MSKLLPIPAPKNLLPSQMPAAPRIETERLVLRGFRREDEEDFMALMADDQVAKWITPEAAAQPRPLAWRSFVGAAGMWAVRGFGMFAVEEKASGRMIGRIGPHYPEGWPDLEIGWSIGSPWWGKGYAVEAARASAAWTFETIPLQRFIAVIAPANTNSQRVAQKLGMRNTKEVFHLFGKDLDIWEMTREMWEGRDNGRDYD